MFSKVAFLSALLSLTFGAPVSVTGKTIHIPLRKEVSTLPYKNATTFSRRSEPNQALEFTGIRYYADYQIGGQTQTGLLDTGSSDTFTFSNAAWSGGYVPGESSDYEYLNNDFSAAFGDGSNQIAGTWCLDSITVGGATLQDYEIAYLNQSVPSFPNNIGILAVGPQSAETTKSKYAPLYSRYKQAGLTDSSGFSLYTTDAEGTKASLLFGGIDTAKYDGPLYSLPFATQEATVGSNYYAVDWQYDGVWYENGVLDSGTPAILLPQTVAASIASEYGATWDDNEGAFISQTQDLSKPPLTITVGGVDVKIPPEFLFMPLNGVYYFGVQPSIVELDGLISMNILGDPFLRSVYSFYDTDNATYYFAPIKVTSDSNIVGIDGDVPGSQDAPDTSEGHTGNGNPEGCVIC